MDAWNGFKGVEWKNSINLRDFIQNNYTPYLGNDEFLMPATNRTKKLMEKVNDLLKKEMEKGGVLDINTHTISSLVTYPAAYLDKELELILGFQTDSPLKRGLNPFGGIRMVRTACEAYGYKVDDNIEEEFTYRTTHNSGVFRVYTEEMRKARNIGLLTGLPDAYGRGRIIGDYRRIALYGVDYLISQKEIDKKNVGKNLMDQDNIRLSEELFQQIAFLKYLKEMALLYGIDISNPAKDTKEAIQFTYFGYLAAVKEQNGAAMSLGRVSTFIDIYAERDLLNGVYSESEIQEFIDDFVIKLRMVRQLRIPEYNELFGGDPTWITESLGGMGLDGRTLVTKNSFRMLNTLYNLGSAPEPNLTILYSKDLPVGFKNFCCQVSIDNSSIQYENDDIMRLEYGDDYGIACCVSPMKIGKQMQFFGARCNLPKLLLLALNGGYDNVSCKTIGPQMEVYKDELLNIDDVLSRLNTYREWLSNLYVNTMNVIHYMHDKYYYEKIQMALHDTDVSRVMAFGVAGFSVLTDSLSAIKYGNCRVVRDDNGYIVDFVCDKDFPTFGNDIDDVDMIGVAELEKMIAQLRKTPTYRNAKHTLSVLTITSNVVYGKKTGSTPCGRKKGEPFAPGANPMHNREKNGALASLNSVTKLPYEACLDGISNTFSIVPDALGKTKEMRIANLSTILDGYFINKAHHININVLNKEMLVSAYNDPSLYPNLTIRVSGYAVNFHRLSREQQKEVISRTFHATI